jgi:uncharacterized membrane protein YoaK (UPF0700 family)
MTVPVALVLLTMLARALNHSDLMTFAHQPGRETRHMKTESERGQLSSIQAEQSPVAQSTSPASATDQLRWYGGRGRSLLAHRRFGPLPGLLLIMTAITGLVDAVSILALGRVFVANMTGNVVFAGFAVVGAPGFSLSASLFALLGFLAGAAVGGGLITWADRDRGVLVRASSATELALAVAALLVAIMSGAPGVSHGTADMVGGAFGPAVTDAVAALLAVAMGVQNAVARKLAVPDMTTTVLTMTLTGLGADLRAVIREKGRVDSADRTALSDFGRRLLVIATMLAGSVTGAWLVLRVSPLSALSLATALLVVVAVGAAFTASRPGAWRTAPPASGER